MLALSQYYLVSEALAPVISTWTRTSLILLCFLHTMALFFDKNVPIIQKWFRGSQSQRKPQACRNVYVVCKTARQKYQSSQNSVYTSSIQHSLSIFWKRSVTPNKKQTNKKQNKTKKKLNSRRSCPSFVLIQLLSSIER